MNIETLELIHKLLTEHKDNASRCCDRARGKRNSTPDDDQNYERYDMKLREADKAKFAAQDAESCGDPIAVAEIYQHDAEALRAARAVLEGLELSNGLVVERSGKNSALKVADPTGQRAGQQLPICQRDELHPCGADRFDSRPSAAGQKGAIVGRDFSRDSAVCQR